MFVRIPRNFYQENFIRENANLTTGNLYFHPHPLLRWVFWERLRQIYRLVREIKAETVLDLGCGGGELLPTLAGLFPRIWGIDLQVTNARRVVEYYQLKNVTLIEGDFLTHDFRPAFFDLVVAADVLEHQRDLEVFCRRMHSVLKTGGIAVVCLPREGFFYHLGRKLFRISPPEDHFQSYREIRAGLERHFQVQGISGLPFILPLFAVFKCFKK
ncbi:MAG: class I SAM-dependent methyltransferase [Proteobacteria bacterium]|nr:class I SAM-dependent methyltransferase [Pseudomonadota bacterium]